MHDFLYGTYLAFRVKEIVDAADRPLTVRQITAEVADVSGRDKVNLARRVRTALNALELKREWHRENNIIYYTYQCHTHESEE